MQSEGYTLCVRANRLPYLVTPTIIITYLLVKFDKKNYKKSSKIKGLRYGDKIITYKIAVKNTGYHAGVFMYLYEIFLAASSTPRTLSVRAMYSSSII